MNHNKIIIVLLIIIAALAVTGFVILNQTGNKTTNVTTANNTTLISANNTTVEHLANNTDASGRGNYIEGPEVDSHGVTKEQVMRAGGDVKYDEKNGIYVQYDPVRGIYHD